MPEKYLRITDAVVERFGWFGGRDATYTPVERDPVVILPLPLGPTPLRVGHRQEGGEAEDGRAAAAGSEVARVCRVRLRR
jgi:hypothetical protein